MDSGTPGTASRAGSVPAGSFPTDPSEFDKDPRVSFSKLDNQYILETDDDREFLWDTGIKRWVESVCRPLLLLPGGGRMPAWVAHDVLGANLTFLLDRRGALAPAARGLQGRGRR
jgi:hypothetical protein